MGWDEIGLNRSWAEAEVEARLSSEALGAPRRSTAYSGRQRGGAHPGTAPGTVPPRGTGKGKGKAGRKGKRREKWE